MPNENIANIGTQTMSYDELSSIITSLVHIIDETDEAELDHGFDLMTCIKIEEAIIKIQNSGFDMDTPIDILSDDASVTLKQFIEDMQILLIGAHMSRIGGGSKNLESLMNESDVA